MLPAVLVASLAELADQLDPRVLELAARGDDVLDEESDHDAIRRELLRRLGSATSEQLHRVTVLGDELDHRSLFGHGVQAEHVTEERP